MVLAAGAGDRGWPGEVSGHPPAPMVAVNNPAPGTFYRPVSRASLSDFQYCSAVQSNRNLPVLVKLPFVGSRFLASSRVNRSSSGPDRNIPQSDPWWHVATQYFLLSIVTSYNPSLRLAGP